MNPHQHGWGLATSFPVAATVAGTTLLGLVFTQDRRNPFSAPAVLMLAVFMFWICVGFPFSFHLEDSKEMLSKVLKIDLMVIVSVALIMSRRQIDWFCWVVVFSLGFYGVKGGIFTISTGGAHRVWGPAGFIEGNNEIALAMIMTIPLMFYIYLRVPAAKRWMRYGLVAAMVLTATASLGSQSRGALLAISAMAAFLWWRSDRKGWLGILLVVVAAGLVAFMPSTWMDRMNTIETYESDSSAMGRINAWQMAINLANDHPITGGGFAIYEPDVFAKYAPDPHAIHAAHSVYFQVLGEHGWVGLAVWLLVWVFTWSSASWVRKHGSDEDDTLWCRQLASMCQVSLVGYAVGGAFLSLAYFDLPYNIMVLVVTTKAWLQHHKVEQKQTAASTPVSTLAV